MSKFVVENVIEAEDLNEALKIAHENIYFADIDVDEIRVRAVHDEDDPYRTFGDLAVETNPNVVARITEPYKE